MKQLYIWSPNFGPKLTIAYINRGKNTDKCFDCNPADYDILNTLKSEKYWSSGLIEEERPVDIVIDLRQPYQISGFYLDLGDALIPERIDIFKTGQGRGSHRFCFLY